MTKTTKTPQSTSFTPELIAPAGDFEKMQAAFAYGADAVYCSTPDFSMRTREIGFNDETLKEAIEYAHKLGKKVYLTLNVFPHSTEVADMIEHAKKTVALKPDAIIVADPGMVSYLTTNFDIPVHLSTQASTANYLSANFWQSQGVDRVVLAREMSFADIKETSKNSTIDLEAFVHGSMCMAYSGRCQISNYLLGRDPNKGQCAQPCRFKYKFYGVKEDTRPEEYFPIFEDDHGTYLFNSKDLCMIKYVPELIEAGISSFKIEGRLKSVYYVGCVVRAYRKAIDLYMKDPAEYEKQKENLFDEVSKLANREFTTGFYFNKPNTETNNYRSTKAVANWAYIGLVKELNVGAEGKGGSTGILKLEIKNRLSVGAELEIVTQGEIYHYTLEEMTSEGEPVTETHANRMIEIKVSEEIAKATVPGNFVRVKLD